MCEYDVHARAITTLHPLAHRVVGAHIFVATRMEKKKEKKTDSVWFTTAESLVVVCVLCFQKKVFSPPSKAPSLSPVYKTSKPFV